MFELWLFRHGETDWNKVMRWHGNSDPSLNTQGRRQARRLGRRLQGQRFDRVYSSGLKRTQETAELALPGVEVLVDSRLAELSFGALEGCTWEGLTVEQQERVERWWRDPYGEVPAEGAEGMAALDERVWAWMSGLPKEGRGAAFTHGGVIRSLLWQLLGVTSVGRPCLQMDFAGITRVAWWGETCAILSMNDCAHLG